MSMNEMPNQPNILSEDQQLILDGFTSIYVNPNAGALEIAHTDQAVAETRDRIKQFGLELTNEKEFYDVMVGLIVGVGAVEGLVEAGVPLTTAAEVARRSLAGLRPRR